MKRISRPFPTVAVAAWLASTCCAASAGCEPETNSDTSAPTSGAHVNPKAGAEPLATSPLDPSQKATLARGEYLVTIGGCHDCHTPLMAGPTGSTPRRRMRGAPPHGRRVRPSAGGRSRRAVEAVSFLSGGGSGRVTGARPFSYRNPRIRA